MSQKGYVASLINRLETATRSTLLPAFDHIIDNGQIGGIEHGKKAINFRWYRLDGLTHATPGAEFTMAHGLGVTPLHLFPFVPLTSSGAQLVRLTVTRPADETRLYLSSPDTSASFSILVEV